MSEEKKSIDLEKAFRDAESVQTFDDPELINRKNLWDMIRVKDRMNLTYILLGREDDKSTWFWLNYNGESVESLEKYVKWRTEADKMFGSKRRSDDEMNQVKNLALSIGNICNVVEDSDFHNQLTMLIMSSLAYKWYSKDHPGVDMNAVSDDDRQTYLVLVSTYFQWFGDMVMGVAGTMSQQDDAPCVSEEGISTTPTGEEKK